MSSSSPQGYGLSTNYLSPKINFGWIGESWEIYRHGWGAWVLLYVCAGGAVLIPSIVISIAAAVQLTSRSGRNSSPTVFDVVMDLLLCLFAFLVGCCSADIAVRQVRGETVSGIGVFRGLQLTGPMLLYSTLFLLALVAGMCVLCFGVFAALGLLLPAFAMVADGISPIQAFSKSIEAMKRDWLNAALFCCVLYVISWFGSAITCSIGSLVLCPMMYIVSALAYRDMAGMPLSTSSAFAQGGYPAHSQAGVWPPAPGQTPPDPTVPPGT